jgi:Periplasmic binding protein
MGLISMPQQASFVHERIETHHLKNVKILLNPADANAISRGIMIDCACCHSRVDRAGATAMTILIAVMVAGPAAAQSGAPIKIGYSMSLTGGLAPNGKSALLAQRTWEEDTNAKGGMLGRPVKLIYYDDKSSPSEIPAIYTKLLDIDKVDLIVGAYGTALTAPAMPIVIQRKKTFIGLLALAVNSQFNYPNYFVMIPSGPDLPSNLSAGQFIGRCQGCPNADLRGLRTAEPTRAPGVGVCNGKGAHGAHHARRERT